MNLVDTDLASNVLVSFSANFFSVSSQRYTAHSTGLTSKLLILTTSVAPFLRKALKFVRWPIDTLTAKTYLWSPRNLNSKPPTLVHQKLQWKGHARQICTVLRSQICLLHPQKDFWLEHNGPIHRWVDENSYFESLATSSNAVDFLMFIFSQDVNSTSWFSKGIKTKN